MNSKYFQKKQSNLKGKVLWFTGLSGSGKSTIAIELESILRDENIQAKILDGDVLRTGLNNNLGFSEEDRTENIRRTAEVAKMFSDSGIIVIVAFITPTQAMRDLARSIIGNEFIVDVYINSSLKICEKRDVKGLYLKARKGEINNFTGINSPFEVPIRTDIEIDTERETIEVCLIKLIDFLAKKNVISY